MSFSLSDANEKAVEGERFTEQNWLYLLQLGKIISGEIQIIYPRYADLSALDSAIPNPANNQMGGIVEGQGLAINKSGTWVLAADDTTAIT